MVWKAVKSSQTLKTWSFLGHSGATLGGEYGPQRCSKGQTGDKWWDKMFFDHLGWFSHLGPTTQDPTTRYAENGHKKSSLFGHFGHSHGIYKGKVRHSHKGGGGCCGGNFPLWDISRFKFV